MFCHIMLLYVFFVFSEVSSGFRRFNSLVRCFELFEWVTLRFLLFFEPFFIEKRSEHHGNNLESISEVFLSVCLGILDGVPTISRNILCFHAFFFTLLKSSRDIRSFKIQWKFLFLRLV